MNQIKSVQLSPSQAKKLWKIALIGLYLPVILAGLSHFLMYPALMLIVFLGYRSKPVYRVLLKDRLSLKYLFGFVSISFLFLIGWQYIGHELARMAVCSVYVIVAVWLGQRLELLSFLVWVKGRTSYHA
jgi:hypothetical protein